MKGIDFIKGLTALSIIFAFDFVVIALIFIEIPTNNEKLFIHLIGIIETAFVGFLVAYYYTRSKGDKPDDPT